jgi:hypothetical protein
MGLTILAHIKAWNRIHETSYDYLKKIINEKLNAYKNAGTIRYYTVFNRKKFVKILTNGRKKLERYITLG